MGSHEGQAAGPFGSIFMGGMFTILKVREGLSSYEKDPGWYQHPPGTVAEAVGERQAVAPTTTLPLRRPVPRPPDAHPGHGTSGNGPAGGSVGAVLRPPAEVTLQAVKARSCGSHWRGR